MKLYQLRFDLPSQYPFDRLDWYWQAYGEVILPIVQNNSFRRYWFTRYGGLNQNPHILLRYEAKQEVKDFPGIQPSKHHEYDMVGDLSSERFFGTNRRFSDAKQRAEMIFDFLHVGSKLTLAQLSHKDSAGYWCLEKSSDFANNHFGCPLESIHHLFCNLSATPTAVAVCKTNAGTKLMSPLYAKENKLFTSTTQVERVEF